MGNIVLLDELTINKIAAGEVIERPASVVKEMVENSIDAGADTVSIEIKNGGISYIRISDNGKGISKEDMELAFERHATSKIRHSDDLEKVKSMGFRGEALASIAAISKITMISKTENSSMGYSIVIEGGEILEQGEVGCPVGTTITVENLFHNTPVRYKFLKKDFTESGYIEDAITRLALINTGISFKLVNSGKVIINTVGNSDLKSVVYSIYGKEIAENLLNVEYEYENYKVSGVIGKPEIARSNRRNQMFFVNKRFVRDKVLSGASEKAFKGMLPIGRFAFLILNIEMDGKLVDVNVHPAKLEVRFQEESKVFKSIYHSINDTLLKENYLDNSEAEREEKAVEKTIIENVKKEEIETPEIIKEENPMGLFKRMLTNVKPKENKNEFIDSSSHINFIEDIYKTRSIGKITEALKEEPINYTAESSFGNDEKIVTSDIEEDTKEIVEEKIEIQEDTETNEIIKKMAKMKQQIEEELKKDSEDIVEEIEEMSKEIKSEIMPEEKIENKIKELDNEFVENTLEDIEKIQVEASSGNYTPEFEEMYFQLFGVLPTSEKKETVKENIDVIPFENTSIFEDNLIPKREYKYIGIAFNTYILIEIDQDLYLLDQHAAHERVLYEKVKSNYGKKENEVQLMLLPDLVTLTNKEMDIAKENIDVFRKAGFELEEFGDNTMKVMGVPNICLEMETKELFLEILDEIDTVAITAKQEIEERFISTIACKAAVKANMKLSKEEVDNLLKELLLLRNPFTCPHGRPTAIKMNKNEIEKKFSRRK